MDFLREIILNGIKSKELKEDLEPMPLIYMLLSSTYTLGLEEYFYTTKLDIKAEMKKILKILLEGIRR